VGSLACRSEEDLWGARMGVLLEKVVLNLPEVAKPSRSASSIWSRASFMSWSSESSSHGPGKLVFVEDAESHDSPAQPSNCGAARRPVSRRVGGLRSQGSASPPTDQAASRLWAVASSSHAARTSNCPGAAKGAIAHRSIPQPADHLGTLVLLTVLAHPGAGPRISDNAVRSHATWGASSDRMYPMMRCRSPCPRRDQGR